MTSVILCDGALPARDWGQQSVYPVFLEWPGHLVILMIWETRAPYMMTRSNLKFEV